MRLDVRRIPSKSLTILMWALSLIIIIPLYVLILNSFKTSSEAGMFSMAMPREVQWGNFQVALERGRIGVGMRNSLLISSVTAVVANLLSSLMALVFVRRPSKLNDFLFKYVFIGMTIVTAFVTTVRALVDMKLYGTYFGIIMVYIARSIPFTTLLYNRFIVTVPRDLDEAAILDGANAPRLFFQILVPVMKPIIITGLMLSFIGAWNDFVSPLYLLNVSQKWPVLLSIYQFYGQYVDEWNYICAVIVISLAPITIVYLAGQKYVIAGLTSGAVKG